MPVELQEFEFSSSALNDEHDFSDSLSFANWKSFYNSISYDERRFILQFSLGVHELTSSIR